MIELAELDMGRAADRRRFTELPFRLAAEHLLWHPGVRRVHDQVVDPARYAFWARHPGSFFVVLLDGVIVGRLAVIEPGQIREKPDAAVLAFPDFIDDEDVFATLVQAAASRARKQGATKLVGPFNPDIHHDVGVLVDGHDRRNFAFMGYQPQYYAHHFDCSGFERLADFEAWGLYRETFRADGRLARLAARVERNEALRLRLVDLKRFRRELAVFHRLYCAAFADHWAFEAPTWREFEAIAADLRYVLRAPMALIAEWEREPVGFVLGIPDLNQAAPKTRTGHLTPSFVARLLWRWRAVEETRVMIAGVLPQHRAKGIHLPLFYRVAVNIFGLGYRGGEISWVHGGNDPMEKVLPLLGATRTRTYRVYQKRLHQ